MDSVKHALRASLLSGTVTDLAFIGNTSSVYDWVPCRMVDLDCFLFVQRFDCPLGNWLSATQGRLKAELDADGIDFEIRIVEGPYKPSIERLARPVIVAHLGVFTEEMYRLVAPLKRWAWRKYRCEVEPDRLRQLAPSPPTLHEFVNGRRGLLERLAALETGRVAMLEWTLPDLAQRTIFIDRDSVAFQECCFAYACNCARNHARALGRVEADSLGNEAFFEWYLREEYPFEPLRELLAMKTAARDQGFLHDTARVHENALRYMRSLAHDLNSSG